jgi:minor histocompatibility antigen H13
VSNQPSNLPQPPNRNAATRTGPASSFSKPFFHASIIAYTLGLGTTIFVMNYFHAAQPALLYLVPACLLSSGATALVLKEFKTLLAYDEEEPEHPTEEEKKEK